MSDVVYDAGALVAADRNDRRFWLGHRIRLEAGVVPIVPAPVVAQVSRSPRQAQLRRLLRGCEVLALDEPTAHAVGQLLGRSGTADIVDATVVVVAMAQQAEVVTADRGDISRLAASAGTRLVVTRA
jgi:predicted nucleic acid-binding protein